MMFILLVAILVDGIIGDPKLIWRKINHPVTWMATLLMIGEKHLNNREHGVHILRIIGFTWIISCCIFCFFTAHVIQDWAMITDPNGLLLAIIASIFLAFRSLIDHVNNVNKSMLLNDLKRSRLELSKIVGRETENLDEPSITRASVESLSENFSDGFVAPTFWFLIAGLPGIVTYKMINTADSMIGNKSDRFINFGWASAKIDDLTNYIPARITAIIFSIAALVIRNGNATDGLKVALRDSSLHASPNAGWPEASMAGILGIKLGGPSIYKNGNTKNTAWLGNGREINSRDLSDALKITKSSWAIILIFVLGGTVYEGI